MKTPARSRGTRWGLSTTGVLVGLLVAAACAPQADGEIIPPEIRYGEDICEVCGMIVSEARFAAACVTTDREPHPFDGIGELLVFYHEQPEESIAQCFVHDYETEVWLAADDAFFVVSPEIHTPMGFGIVAVETQKQADALAASSGGDIHTFSELLAASKN